MTITEIELFVSIVNCFQSLTVTAKTSISDIAVVLNTSLNTFGH